MLFMALKHRLMGWEPSDFATYAHAWQRFGGSVNTHPDVIRFIMSGGDKSFTFWHRREKGNVIAAYFVVDERVIGLDVWREYPVSFDEVLIPVAAGQRIWLPDKTSRLSASLSGQVINAAFNYRNKRKVCLVKETFSAKTIKKRKGEMRKFLEMGGECRKLADMPAAEIARLYVYLFKLRFADTVRCYTPENIARLLAAVSPMIFGNVLFFQGNPCAIDLVLKAESDRMIYFDVPNGGVDPQYAHLAPGSLLMWANISDARELCVKEEKKMAFSIGLYEKQWDYKLLWAKAQRTGKSLTL